MKKAKKNDFKKPDISLIPKIALEKEAESFMVGEKKYGRYNFYGGMEATRLIAAAQRHLLAYLEGEENCPVDGQHHLGSVRACCAMILKQEELGTLIDNRYNKKGKLNASNKKRK